MIPVEQLQPADTVLLPNGRQMPVVRVERYDADFVVVYQDGTLEKTMRIMRAGDLVNAERGPTTDPAWADDDGDHEAGRLAILEMYRRFGPMPDSELVERVHEREADAGLPLSPVSQLMRRRRELERRDRIEASGERFHVESGASEPIWMIPPGQPEQTTIADALYPEPDL